MGKGLVEVFLELHAADYADLLAICNRLSHEEIWRAVPGGVPIANLMCHIAEMERFWIDWGLCGEEFQRERQVEFDRRGDLSPGEIAARLAERCAATEARVRRLHERELTPARDFHGDTLTGEAILACHLRHVGTHRGQILSHERWLRGDCVQR